MSENRWDKIRKIRIRPITAAIMIVVIFAFFGAFNDGSDKADTETVTATQQREITEEQATAKPKIRTGNVTEATQMIAEVRDTGQPITLSAEKEAGKETEKEEKPEEGKAENLQPESEPEEPEQDIKKTDYCSKIPLSEEVQEIFNEYCETYNCPLALAIATAEVETNFDENVFGAAGEEGIMQIYPGSGRKYFRELEEKTGHDPGTLEGNIACGCYLLGKYLGKYGDIEKAAMAYNLGTGGAANLWEKGICSTEYSRKIKAAHEKWETVIKDAGIE